MSSEKQIHIRLSCPVVERLKSTCAAQGVSMQVWLAKMISENLAAFPEEKTKRVSWIPDRNVRELIQHNPLFSSISNEEVEKLVKVVKVYHYKKNDLIAREGDEVTSLSIIHNGIVRVFKISTNGKKFVLDVRYDNELFGQHCLVERKPRIASFEALTDVDILTIKRQDFMDLIERNPNLSEKLIGSEEKRLHNLYDKILGLATFNTFERLVNILIGLSIKSGNTLLLSHHDIADMIGTTHETTTRILVQLKHAGVLDLKRNKITILDQNKLHSYSGTSESQKGK